MALENVVEVHDGKAVGAFTSQAKNISYKNGSVEDALDGLQAWSEEVHVQVTDGNFYFSKHPIGLKRIRWALSTSTSDTTYSAIIPDDYLPLVNTTITGYNNNGGLRSAIMYSSTKNIIVTSSSHAGFYSQQIYA